MFRIRLSWTIACAFVLTVLVSAAAMAGGTGPGPNYISPPAEANSGVTFTGGGGVQINWWNWYDENRQLWYYAYQVGNTGSFQPHIANFRMWLMAGDQVNFEGDAYSLGHVPWTYWNRTTTFSGNMKLLGWACDQGQELSPGPPTPQGTSPDPNLFELSSPLAPGNANFKCTDADYVELQSDPTDPSETGTLPGPVVPEPGSLLSLAGLSVLAFIRRRK